MNTKINRIARCQSCLGGFAPSRLLEPAGSSSDGGDDDDDDDDDDDASFSKTDDEMTLSDSPFVTCDKKGK